MDGGGQVSSRTGDRRALPDNVSLDGVSSRFFLEPPSRRPGREEGRRVESLPSGEAGLLAVFGACCGAEASLPVVAPHLVIFDTGDKYIYVAVSGYITQREAVIPVVLQ